MHATAIGHHGGRSRAGKARQLTSRLGALRRWARGRDFDVALAHGSHELTITARRLGIPSATTFDYEWAWLQHQLGCRAATKVVVPDSIPIERLARYGTAPPKLLQYPGPEGGVLPLRLRARPVGARRRGRSSRRARWSCSGRRRTSRSTTGTRTRSSRRRSSISGRLDSVHAVVLPRTEEQRDYVRSLALPSVIVPDAGRRCAEPDRARRPRRLGRRHDEPRGGCARRPGLHDLRRPARRRRRGADPPGPAAAADRSARARAVEALGESAASAPGATRHSLLELLLSATST